MAFQPILDIETQTLFADFEPDLIKIDMALDITVVAEGIETNEERDALRDLGITLQQAFLVLTATSLDQRSHRPHRAASVFPELR